MPIGIVPAIDSNMGARAPGKASSARYRCIHRKVTQSHDDHYPRVC